MLYEVEQKFRLPQPAVLSAALAELGAVLGDAVVQVDRYFAHPARDFAATDEALRVRTVGTRHWITYKGPKIDATTKTRREIELPLSTGEESGLCAAALFEALGFRAVFDVRKQRRTATCEWQGCAVEIAVDHVDGLGDFCELELSADEAGVPAARQVLANLAARLKLVENERRSYLEMLLAQLADAARPRDPHD